MGLKGDVYNYITASNDMGVTLCFGWEIPPITNEEAAWCYVITNVNNKLLVTWTNQNKAIYVHRGQIWIPLGYEPVCKYCNLLPLRTRCHFLGGLL
jgi:hypothetical protein